MIDDYRTVKICPQCGSLKINWIAGEKIPAVTAYDFGLVDIIAANPLDEAIRIATTINNKPENTVMLAKRAVNSTENKIKKDLDYEAALFGILFSEKDTKDRINNFIKRKGI